VERVALAKVIMLEFSAQNADVWSLEVKLRQLREEYLLLIVGCTPN